MNTPPVCFSNNSIAFFDGDGYWNLVDLGASIVTPVMLRYYQDPTGWWYDLLHELLHGERGAAPVIFKDVLFARWKMWFEDGKWNDVPGPKGRGTSYGGRYWY